VPGDADLRFTRPGVRRRARDPHHRAATGREHRGLPRHVRRISQVARDRGVATTASPASVNVAGSIGKGSIWQGLFWWTQRSQYLLSLLAEPCSTDSASERWIQADPIHLVSSCRKTPRDPDPFAAGL